MEDQPTKNIKEIENNDEQENDHPIEIKTWISNILLTA